MKLLKKILIGLLIFIVLLLVLAYFLPRKMEVNVTEKVDAPAKFAYNLLNDFKNQTKWDPWSERDSTMTYAYGEKTLGEGAYMDFKSDSFGEGRTTRTTTTKNSNIVLTTTSEENGGAYMTYDFVASKDGKSSDLTWGFNTEMGWPKNLMSIFFKSSMKKDMKKGISKISKISNDRWKKNTYDGFEVTQEVVESKNYVIQRDIVAIDKSDKFYTQNLQPLFMKIQKAGVEMEGNSSILVYNHNMQDMTLDMATAIPIKEEVAIEGAGSETLEAGKVLVVNFYGDRANTAGAHNAIDDYMKDRDLLLDYPVVEEYVTDPSEEPDPSKWLTKVIYYIAD